MVLSIVVHIFVVIAETVPTVLPFSVPVVVSSFFVLILIIFIVSGLSQFISLPSPIGENPFVFLLFH